jgi:hypothetical protein
MSKVRYLSGSLQVPTPEAVEDERPNGHPLHQSVVQPGGRARHTHVQERSAKATKSHAQQCCGSMTFWGGSGSGSADPCLWLFVPDPTILVIDLQDASKKLIFNTIFSAYYFLKLYLHNFFKIKSQKESQISKNQGFSYYFCIMIEGSGSIPQTSGSGSGRPKNMWIRIRNTGYNPEHFGELEWEASGDKQCQHRERIGWPLPHHTDVFATRLPGWLNTTLQQQQRTVSAVSAWQFKAGILNLIFKKLASVFWVKNT